MSSGSDTDSGGEISSENRRAAKAALWLIDLYLQQSHKHLREADGQYCNTNLCTRCSQLSNSIATGHDTRDRSWFVSEAFPPGHGTYFSLRLIEDTCPLCIFAVNVAQYASRTRGSHPTPFNSNVDSLWLNTQGPFPGFHNGRYLVAALTSPTDQQVTTIPSLYGLRLQADAIDFKLLRGWISQCIKNHDCGGSQDRPIPYGFRLVDCQTGKTVSGITAAQVEYATLSYVWGQRQDDEAAQKTFEEWSLDCDIPAGCPSVVRDAMEVVTKLGYRYLWIDRYCIPQNKDDKESARALADNLGVMGTIYASSVFTIIAAYGKDASYGLPGLSCRRVPQPAITLGGRQIVGVTAPAKAILESTWYTRGWTFQEEILSSRRLVFTEHQVYFQCSDAQYVESLAGAAPFNIEVLNAGVFPPYRDDSTPSEFGPGLGESNYTDDYNPWLPRNLLQAFGYIARFAPRRFTYPKDAYDAFRGVVQMLKSRPHPVHFFLGLPIVTTFPELHSEVDDSGDRVLSRSLKDARGPNDHMGGLALALSWYPSEALAGWTTTKIYLRGVRSRTMTRRREFPSWTWLGWSDFPRDFEYHIFHKNEGKGYHGYITLRTYHLHSATVEFAGEAPAPWGLGWQHLCDKARTSTIKYLNVSGWLFELSIDINRWVRASKPTSWYIPTAFRPPNWKTDPEEASRECLLDIFDGREKDWSEVFGTKPTQTFTALLLTSIHSCRVSYAVPRTEPAIFGLIVLKQLPEPNTYERFDFISMPAPHDFEQVDEATARIGPFTLHRTTIRLK